MTIQITTGNYGFERKWTLCAFGRKFYLGQDVKFCSRVLGMSPQSIKEEIGSNDLRAESARKKLARIICDKLDINRTTVKAIEPWGLAAD